MEFNTEALQPNAEQFVGLLMRELNLGECQGVRTLETDIHRGLHEIGLQMLGLIISYADGVAERRLACEGGGRLENKRRCEAQVLSVFDWVKYEHSYYAVCICGKGKAPLDGRFGLQAGQVTPGLADLLAMTGAELVFEHSGCFLERFLFFQVSENTVGKETECFGQLQTELEASHKEGSQSSDYLQERLRSHDQPPERVYGAHDGAKVRIEKGQKTAHPASMGSEKVKWREIKVGCWYGVEAVPKSQQRRRQRKKTEVCQQALRTRDMSYYCEIDTSEMFGDLF